MYKELAIAAFTICLSLSSFAADMTDVVKSYELKDGSTLHVFKDGKMGMENQFGRAVSMKEGQTVEAKDGTKVTVKGNEVVRLHNALNKDRRGH